MQEETEELEEKFEEVECEASQHDIDSDGDAAARTAENTAIGLGHDPRYILCGASYADDGFTLDEAARLEAEDAARYGIDLDALASSSFDTPETSKTSETFESSRTQDDIFIESGCKQGFDNDGDPIWIEKETHSGKPVIIYQPKGNRFTRWRYHIFGRNGTTVDGPVCIRGGEG
jgi:hypothetical protein